jgi:hypothetical protein
METFLFINGTMRVLASASRLRTLRLPVQRRSFSGTASRLDNYGFIGLGQMVC